MTPRDLIEDIWSGDVRRWERAWSRLLRVVRNCGAPGLREGDGALVEDAAQSFLETLANDEQRAKKLSVETWSGLEEAIRRELIHSRSDTIEEHPSPFFAHLRRKVARGLKADARFELLDIAKPRRWRLAGVPTRSNSVSPEELAARLPPLPANYDMTQDNHMPVIAKSEDLAELLVRILEDSGNQATTAARLAEFAYGALSPRPVEAQLVPQPIEPTSVGSRPASRRPPKPGEIAGGLVETDLAFIAHDFVSGLEQRTRAAVWLKYCSAEAPVGLEEVASGLRDAGYKASRGTAANEVGDREGRFGRSLGIFIGEHGLDEDEAASFLTRILEVIEAGGFLASGGRQ